MRLAHANVRGGVLCLGDPGGLHVRLRPDGVHTPGWKATEDGAGDEDDQDYDDQDYDDQGYDDPDYDDPDYDDGDDGPDGDGLAGPGGSDYPDDPDDPDDPHSSHDPEAQRPAVGSPWVVTAWRDLAAVEVDAPLTRWRYPGVLSTVVAAVVGTVGIEWYPEGAAFDVEVTTAGGVEVVRCDGFAGRGYWEPHARVVEALLRVLVSEPGTRAWLSTPGDLLGVLSTLARRGPSADALADEVRSALLHAAPEPSR